MKIYNNPHLDTNKLCNNTYNSLVKLIYENNHNSRTIGGAVGSNAISIIVPCHRVNGGNNNGKGNRVFRKHGI